MFEKQIQGESWIVEGVYWSWCKPSFEKADKIIFLVTPHRVRQWRLISRFVKRKLGIESSIKKDSLIKGYINTAIWNYKWDHENLPGLKAVMAQFHAKIEYL